MQAHALPLRFAKRTYRITVSVLFFLQGLCFASWASRIPSIQQQLNLSETELGAVLFALPVGSMISLPLSGWVVSRLGSRKVVLASLLLYSLILITLGLAQTRFQLIGCLLLFGMAGNISNISINTQAVGVEAVYGRSVMASFHGMWSLAGFTAALVGSVMIGNNIPPWQHFLAIAILLLTTLGISYRTTLQQDVNSTASQRIFVKPDRSLLHLGIIAFCIMICEGAMFDWSGVYFKKVVLAEKAWIGAGYTAFMSTMATGRFIADWSTQKAGLKKTLQLSGALTALGLLLSVLLPFLPTAIFGFFLVGFGVSSVVPLVYSAAGKSKVMSAGMALAAVSSIGFLGFLIGPPLIGIVAGAATLRLSFTIIALMGAFVAIMAGKLRE